MRHKTKPIIVLYLLGLTLGPFFIVYGDSTKKGDIHNLFSARPVFISITQNDQTSPSQPKQPDLSGEDRKSDLKQASPSSVPGKKTAPFKDLVPSEKIEAEKAVDFPADI